MWRSIRAVAASPHEHPAAAAFIPFLPLIAIVGAYRLLEWLC